MLELLHGTSTDRLASIQEQGLNSPFLTDDVEIAQYYAEEAAEDHSGMPVILRVLVRDLSKLRYDGAAMDEPVLRDEEEIQEALNEVADDHPEWVKGDLIIVPKTAWQVSLVIVSSVLYEGQIGAADIKLLR